MRELARLILRSGLLAENQVKEFQRWGQLEETEDSKPVPETAEQFVLEVEKALEEEEMVIIRETDLEVLNCYAQGGRQGELHIEVLNVNGTDAPVRYGQLLTGEFVLHWMGENMMDILTNGLSYLRLEDGERVYFESVRELFYGEVKAFVVCMPESSKPLKQLKESNGSDTPNSDPS